MRKVVLVILILLVFCGGVIILSSYNREVQQSLNKLSNENIDKKENTFKIKKIEQKEFDSNYTIEKQNTIITIDYFSVEKQNDDLVISLIESDRNKELLKGNESVTYNKKYIISNVTAKDIDDIFYGNEGQDMMYPLVYLLQKDGIVKGIDTEYGYKTGEFIAENISGLNNVERIEQASVTPANDSGYEAIIAITKDKNIYEIRK